jgi:hypothetical protein
MTQTVNKKTMIQMIAQHLLREKSISNVEAQNLYRCRALPKRISELRAAGMDIRPIWKKDITGQRYVRYFFMGR